MHNNFKKNDSNCHNKMDLHNDEISNLIKKKIRKCGVFMCNNVSGEGISFHLMPQQDDLKRRKDWISVLKLNARKIPQSFVVCSQHFIETDFISKFCLTRSTLQRVKQAFTY